MSDPQKDQGYLLPDPIEGWDLICVTLKIPDTPEYRSAFRGALKSLTEWHEWQRTGDTKGSQAATYWRQIINEHLIIQDCDELEFIGCCNMGQFRLRKCYDEEGEYYEWTINDGCTWHRAEECEDGDGTPSEPPPTDPIDDGGTYPEPVAEGDRCRIINSTFKRVFDDAGVFFSSVIDISASGRPYALQQWLDSRDENGNGLQWYDAFSSFLSQYIDGDFILAFADAYEGALWDEFILCVVSECYPLLADIDREAMLCIAEGIDTVADGLDEMVAANAIFSLRYIADLYRIYPLSAMRANAFRDSINLEVSDLCPDCDEPEPGVCLPRFLDFETAPVWLTLTTGAVESGFARSGLSCLKGVNMGAINGAQVASYVMDFSVEMEDVCEIERVKMYIKLNNSNPDSNANAVQSIPFRIFIYNGASLVFTKEYTYRPYYYTVSSKWNGINILMDSPLAVGDKVQIYSYFNTRIAGRIINYRMDDVTVNVVTG